MKAELEISLLYYYILLGPGISPEEEFGGAAVIMKE